MEQVKLDLKQKYALVHVPGEYKIRMWYRLTKELIEEGQPAEQAGITAAKKVFPYECREHRVYAEKPVQALLQAMEQ
jgi:hypothetical protein